MDITTLKYNNYKYIIVWHWNDYKLLLNYDYCNHFLFSVNNAAICVKSRGDILTHKQAVFMCVDVVTHARKIRPFADFHCAFRSCPVFEHQEFNLERAH